MRNNKGMTLVEVVVTMIILSIIMVALGGVYLSSMENLSHYSDKRTSKMVLDTVSDFCVDNLTYATDVTVACMDTIPENVDDMEIPVGWTREETKWITFKKFSDGGRIGFKGIDDIYGDEYYSKGSLDVSITYVNANTEEDSNTKGSDVLTKKNLNFNIGYTDSDGNRTYERDKTLDIINLSWFDKDISGDSGLDNSTKNIVIFYRQSENKINTSGQSEELRLWTVMNSIFETTVAKDRDFYTLHVPQYIISDVDGSQVGPINNDHGCLGWQYRASDQGGSWKAGYRVEEFMILTDDKLDELGLTDKIDSSKTWYLVPYHYVKNTEKCDILFYVHDTYFFDNESNQSGGKQSRLTNLIYNNDEDRWYYFKLNETSGTRGTCTALWINGVAQTGLRPDANYESKNVITYTDDYSDERHVVEINSSYQIKQFFRQYGVPITKK